MTKRTEECEHNSEIYLSERAGMYIKPNLRHAECSICGLVKPWYTGCSDEAGASGLCGPIVFITDAPTPDMLRLGYEAEEALRPGRPYFAKVEVGSVVVVERRLIGKRSEKLESRRCAALEIQPEQPPIEAPSEA